MAVFLIIATYSNMLMHKLFKIERPFRLDVEPLAQEAVHAKYGRVLEAKAELEIDIAEETGLEAVKDHLVPDYPRRKEAFLPDGCPAVVDFDGFDDVECLRGPGFLAIVPPGVFVVVGDVSDAEQRELDPLEIAAIIRPTQELQQLQAGELDFAAGEVALLLGQLDQGEYHRIIQEATTTAHEHWGDLRLP